MAIFQLVCFFMFKIKIRDCNVLEVLKQRCATIQEIRNRCLNEELRMAFFFIFNSFQQIDWIFNATIGRIRKSFKRRLKEETADCSMTLLSNYV